MTPLEQKLEELQQAYEQHSKAIEDASKELKDAETRHSLERKPLTDKQFALGDMWERIFPNQDTLYSQMQLSKKGTQVVFKIWPDHYQAHPHQVIRLEDILSHNPALKELLIPERQTFVESKYPIAENITSITVVSPILRQQLESSWQAVMNRLDDETQKADKNITAHNEELINKIAEASGTLEEKKKEFEDFKKQYDPESRYITRAISTSRKTPGIAKDKHSRFDDKPFYSLWLGDSPVFLYDGASVTYLHTNKKNKPLEAKKVSADSTISADNKKLAEKFLGLKQGTFCDISGFVLTGQQEEIASKIFEHVFTGVEILPHEDSPSGYEAREPKNARNAATAIQPRHWSQVYLAQKTPNKTVVGKLLGSGGSYKAYQYGDKTVVEFDQEGHATYLFATQYFDSLRTWQKTALLESKPEGFQGRLIHKEDRQDWMKNIDDFVKN